MLNLLLRALLFWLSLFELLAGWRGWWGLSWLGRSFPRALLPLLALAALRAAPARAGRLAAGLALAAPPALLFQAIAGSLRNHALDPRERLRPGAYADRDITRVDIPLAEGYLPALHIVPRGGASAAVCVLHGSGCDKTAYVWRLADALLTRGLAILLIDLDGHGENPRPQSFPAILENASVAVAWLRARYRRVGLLGISLGGCIAARAAADGLPVDALALLETPPLLHYTQADIWREALALVRPHLFNVFDNCTAYYLVRAWEFAPIRATISTWDLIAACNLLGSLPKITAPLLLLYGALDAIVKPAQAAQARKAAPPGALFYLMPGASHLTLILTDRALRIIGDWLVQTLITTQGET